MFHYRRETRSRWSSSGKSK